MSAKKKETRRRFRTAVFTRAGYCCQCCGFVSSPERVEQELDAHHITDRNEIPNGGYVAENGIALCSMCHAHAEAFHRGDPVLPGFTPAELYAIIGSREETARAASELLQTAEP